MSMPTKRKQAVEESFGIELSGVEWQKSQETAKARIENQKRLELLKEKVLLKIEGSKAAISGLTRLVGGVGEEGLQKCFELGLGNIDFDNLGDEFVPEENAENIDINALFQRMEHFNPESLDVESLKSQLNNFIKANLILQQAFAELNYDPEHQKLEQNLLEINRVKGLIVVGGTLQEDVPARVIVLSNGVDADYKIATAYGEREKLRKQILTEEGIVNGSVVSTTTGYDGLGAAMRQDKAVPQATLQKQQHILELQKANLELVGQAFEINELIEEARVKPSNDPDVFGGFEAECADFKEIAGDGEATSRVIEILRTSVERKKEFIIRRDQLEGEINSLRAEVGLGRGDEGAIATLRRRLRAVEAAEAGAAEAEAAEAEAAEAEAAEAAAAAAEEVGEDFEEGNSIYDAYVQLQESFNKYTDLLTRKSEWIGHIEEQIDQNNQHITRFSASRTTVAEIKARRAAGGVAADDSSMKEFKESCNDIQFIEELQMLLLKEGLKSFCAILTERLERGLGDGVDNFLRSLITLSAAEETKAFSNIADKLAATREAFFEKQTTNKAQKYVKDQKQKLEKADQDIVEMVELRCAAAGKELSEHHSEAKSADALMGSGTAEYTTEIRRVEMEVRRVGDEASKEALDAGAVDPVIDEFQKLRKEIAEGLAEGMKELFDINYSEENKKSFGPNSIGIGSAMNNFANIELDGENLKIPVISGNGEDLKTLVENYFGIEGCEVDRTDSPEVLVVPLNQAISKIISNDGNAEQFFRTALHKREEAKKSAIKPLSSSGEWTARLISLGGILPLAAFVVGAIARVAGKVCEAIAGVSESKRLGPVAAFTGGVFGGLFSSAASLCNGLAKTAFDGATTMFKSSGTGYGGMASLSKEYSKGIENSEKERLKPMKDDLGRQGVRALHKGFIAPLFGAISVVPYSCAALTSVIGDSLYNAGALLREKTKNSNIGFLARPVEGFLKFVGSIVKIGTESLAACGKVLAAPGMNLTSLDDKDNEVLSTAGHISRFAKGIEDKAKMTVAEKLVIVDRKNYSPAFAVKAESSTTSLDNWKQSYAREGSVDSLNGVHEMVDEIVRHIPILHEKANVVLSIKDEDKKFKGPRHYIQFAQFKTDNLDEYKILQSQSGEILIVDKNNKLVKSEEFTEEKAESFRKSFYAAIDKLLPQPRPTEAESDKEKDVRQGKVGVTLEDLSSLKPQDLFAQLEIMYNTKVKNNPNNKTYSRTVDNSDPSNVTATYKIKLTDDTVFEVSVPVTVREVTEERGRKSTKQQVVSLKSGDDVPAISVKTNEDEEHAVLSTKAIKADSLQLLTALAKLTKQAQEEEKKPEKQPSRARQLQPRGAPRGAGASKVSGGRGGTASGRGGAGS